MEYILYNSNIKNDELLKYNIFISPTASLQDGVKLFYGVKVYGNSEIGKNTELHSNCEICDSIIGTNCKIFSSVITNSRIEQDCVVKPFVHIEDSSIERECVIGNFTCICSSILGISNKIFSLSNIRKTEIGNGCVLESGVCCEPCDDEAITIGDNVHIMCNASIINSAVISDNCVVYSNCVVSQDVEANKVVNSTSKNVLKNVK